MGIETEISIRQDRQKELYQIIKTLRKMNEVYGRDYLLKVQITDLSSDEVIETGLNTASLLRAVMDEELYNWCKIIDLEEQLNS